VSEDDDNSDVAKDRLRRDAIGPKASTTCVGASYFCCSLNLISNGMEDNSLDVVIASFRTFRALIESKRTNPLFSNDPNDCLEDCRHIRKSLKIITPKILKRLDIKCPGVLRNLAQTCALSLAKASVMDGLVIVMPFLGDIEISPYARLSALYILILEFGISNTRGSPIQCKIATTLLEPALKDTNEHLIRKAIAVIIAMTRFVDLDVILTHVRDIGPDALDIVTKKMEAVKKISNQGVTFDGSKLNAEIEEYKCSNGHDEMLSESGIISLQSHHRPRSVEGRPSLTNKFKSRKSLLDLDGKWSSKLQTRPRSAPNAGEKMNDGGFKSMFVQYTDDRTFYNEGQHQSMRQEHCFQHDMIRSSSSLIDRPANKGCEASKDIEKRIHNLNAELSNGKDGTPLPDRSSDVDKCEIETNSTSTITQSN